MKKALIVLSAAFALAACASSERPNVSLTYTPAGTIELTGHMDVKEFAYTEEEAKAPNHIPNSAIGNIYITEPVGQYFANALKQELRTAKVSLQGDVNCSIEGTIQRLKLGDLGFSVDYTLEVNYSVKNKVGDELFSAHRNTFMEASKFGGLTTLSKVFSENISGFLTEPELEQLLTEDCV